MSYRLGVTVSCRLGATVSYLLGATLSYRLGAIGPRFCTIFVYPLTFLVGPKVFSGKTSLLNSVQWSGRAHVGQIPETKPYSYQTLLLGSADISGVTQHLLGSCAHNEVRLAQSLPLCRLLLKAG